MSYQTLFLQQSYRDCTKQYEEILHNPNLPLWDYVVLTASNEAQAQAYRAQISYRLKHQMLPEKTHYAVLPDPDGKRRVRLPCCMAQCRVTAQQRAGS